ncbi:DsbA family oxidoreductase [Paenibacillus monticola]|uniref:DsbA family oxidoreductase n=1 Tax=Paenibacillus monticola TaxID=2666075 RepID=A0A7X2H5I7_9BACL|nr:DsbA family oxidoreductase [Paenibacillus monticola]MRN53927.1 DsbA family oxidoreductase [Paenibacillus monticola]
MKVEIWFDYTCPFCYIGKKKFEAALEQFDYKNEVEIVLHSFEMTPDEYPQAGESIYEFASKLAGMSASQARHAYIQVTDMARMVGLNYRFDQTIPANTFAAHRLTHYAAAHGKAYELSERIFRAYFTDGLNINDHTTLALLAAETGLDETKSLAILESNQYATDVHKDAKDSRLATVGGMPYFLFNETYSVSGARDSSLFKEVLNQAWSKLETVSVENTESATEPGCLNDSCPIK